MNRRDFLHPRRIAETAGQVVSAFQELHAELEHDLAEDTAVVRFGRRAMATTFEVVLPFGTTDALAIAEAALDEIDRLESQLTVYRDSSEVSRLNQLARHFPVPVESGLFGLLAQSSSLNAETDGAFDISAGALIKAWGFFRGPRRVPEDAERELALSKVGMKHVQLDAGGKTVRYLRDGLEINLGSIGKGYALDQAAALLRREWNSSSALLHGGQSSVYAIGTPPGDRRGWTVGLRHPWDPQRRLAMVRLADQALGTSAATFQHLEYNGRKLGHILDPRTGWPAEGMASVSIIAPTAAQADALATAFYILGVEKARQYCASHPEIGAILLPEGDDAEMVVCGIAAQQCVLESLDSE